MSETETAAPAEWAIVEIFGHRRHPGAIREEERFGAKMLRLDVPTPVEGADPTWKTHWYGGASIFSITPTDEANVMRINTPYRAPSLYLPQADDEDEDEDSIAGEVDDCPI